VSAVGDLEAEERERERETIESGEETARLWRRLSARVEVKVDGGGAGGGEGRLRAGEGKIGARGAEGKVCERGVMGKGEADGRFGAEGKGRVVLRGGAEGKGRLFRFKVEEPKYPLPSTLADVVSRGTGEKEGDGTHHLPSRDPPPASIPRCRASLPLRARCTLTEAAGGT
jgi:hypothetical protein